MTLRKIILCGQVSLAALGIAATAPALAQVTTTPSTAGATPPQDGATPTPAPGDELGDIVVTAQNRQESAQRAAVAMTVFDAETLRRNNVQNLQDLSKIAPAVSLGQNSANVIVTVRGVSSRDTNEIGDPAVSVSNDGFFIQRPTGLSGALYDLERVEVLRGPQGTLYGRSATGGAINFISAKPELNTTAARLSFGYGNYDALTTDGMVNLPLGDKVALRGAYSIARHDGYRTNEAPATPGDDLQSESARLHLLLKPTDRLSILLTGQYTHLGGVGPTVYGTPIVGATNNAVRPSLDTEGSPHGLPNQFIDTTIKTIQGRIDYDLDIATISYQGGYRDMRYAQLRDLDGLATSANYFNPHEQPHDQSHELRAVSNSTGPFRWQAGLYYFDEHNDLLTYYQSYAANPAVAVNRFVYSYSVYTRTEAAYGQASYEVLPGLSVEGGIRYSEDKKRRRGFQNLGAGNVPQNGDTSSTKTTYHAALNYQVTPRNLLYAKYDTGYKAGGFTDVLGVGILEYRPETIESYEVGSKNRFLGNTLQLNLTGYLYNYKDQQASVVNPNGNSAGAGTTYIVNVGRSRLYGGEAEILWKPGGADQFDASIAYLHGRFQDFCTARSSTGACTRDFSGNRPVQAPEWQINAGYEHTFGDVFGGTLTPRVQTHYESSSFLGIENYVRQRQDSFSRSDVLVTYTAPDRAWSLQGYVRNIEDETVFTAANASFGAYNYAFTPPRTYGARVTFNF